MDGGGGHLAVRAAVHVRKKNLNFKQFLYAKSALLKYY